jgi:hypothetical protein
MLGAKAFHSVSARAAYLAERIRVKYRKYLEFPVWQKADIAALGYNLRQAITEKIDVKHWLLARLANLDMTAQGFDVVPIRDEFSELLQKYKSSEW